MLGNFANDINVGNTVVINSVSQSAANKVSITPPYGTFTLTTSSNTVTIGSVPSGVVAGQYVTGTGIPTGTTVYSVGSGSIVLTNVPTTAGGQTLTFNNPSNIIDNTLSATLYRSADFTVTITLTDSSTPGTVYYQSSKYNVLHDGVNTYGTEYGVINNGNILGTLSSDINGSIVRLKMTQTANLTSTQSMSVSIARIALAV